MHVVELEAKRRNYMNMCSVVSLLIIMRGRPNRRKEGERI
jgi:hypothetical protein